MQKVILIVDEAHNLPETAVDISSSNLSLFMMQQAELEAKRFGYDDAEVFAKLLYEETEKRAANVRKEEADSSQNSWIQFGRKREYWRREVSTCTWAKSATKSKRRCFQRAKHPRSYINAMSEFLLRWDGNSGQTKPTSTLSANILPEKTHKLPNSKLSRWTRRK